MKLLNSITGKISTSIIGPKHYLHEDIRLGEMAVCIARDERQPLKPYVWIIGGVEQLTDYVSLSRSEGVIAESDAVSILAQLDAAKKKMPKTALERLASALSCDVDELKETIELAQVCLSAPISGVQDHSTNKPKWMPKTPNHASIH
jgi:hypothetical protein